MPPKRRAAAAAAKKTVAKESAAEEVAADQGKDLDAERQALMAKNAAALAAFGVTKAVAHVRQAAADEAQKALQGRPTAAKVDGVRNAGVRKPRACAPRPPPRRSQRLTGQPAPAMVELDDDGNPVRAAAGGDGGDAEGELGGNLDLMAVGAARVNQDVSEDGELSEKQRAAHVACPARVHDQTLGISCHFCRQKTLCNEEKCPRCSARDAEADCIGKSFCTGCRSANGVFCAPCLRVRYGQDMKKVRNDPSWRCPHCYVEKHGDCYVHGWFCNSSFCMQKARRAPTGIAIHKAVAAGFASVQHMLQAKVLALAEAKGEEAGSNARAAVQKCLEDGTRWAVEKEAPAQAVGGNGAEGSAAAVAAAAAVELGSPGPAP